MKNRYIHSKCLYGVALGSNAVYKLTSAGYLYKYKGNQKNIICIYI